MKGFGMFLKKNSIAVLAIALAISFATPLMAGESMVFKQKLATKTIYSGTSDWKSCGNVKFDAIKDGYVVVTASGNVQYNNKAEVLILSLATKAAVEGPWNFGVTATLPAPYQSFSIRMVFSVEAGQSYAFHLNGRSIEDGGPGKILVQPGSITAEFYSKEDVTPLASQKPAAEAQTDQNATDRPLLNSP
jgi:hypothetical protein